MENSEEEDDSGNGHLIKISMPDKLLVKPIFITQELNAEFHMITVPTRRMVSKNISIVLYLMDRLLWTK